MRLWLYGIPSRRAISMLRGKRFRLRFGIVGFELVHGNREPVIVPAGEVVMVLDALRNGRQVIEVLWQRRPLAMIVEDLTRIGEAIPLRKPQPQASAPAAENPGGM